jgi:hypothetical protein
MALSLTHITSERFAETQKLCAMQFGDKSYQASDQFMQWLYVDNPHRQGRGVLGYEDDKLVAVCHEMAAWSDKFEPAIIAHNLFTYPDTNSGHGGSIVIRYSRLPMVVPGAIPPITHVYDAARFIEIPLRSYRVILKSPKALIKTIYGRLSGQSHLEFSKSKLLEQADRFGIQAQFDLQNAESALHFLAVRDGLAKDFLEYRYFGANSPRTLLLKDTHSNFVFLNIGLRKGIALARIAEHKMDASFLKNRVLPYLASIGVIAVMANSKYCDEWSVLEQCGMQQTNKLLRAFVARKLEAMLTRFT